MVGGGFLMEKDRGLGCWDMSPSNQVVCPLHSHSEGLW